MLTSCFKKEDALVLPKGNTTIQSFYLGNDYKNEVYFDLGTNSYQQRERSNWDMRFETSKDGWGIFINTGNNIRVKKPNVYNLEEPGSYDTAHISFLLSDTLLDAPDGFPETSAFKDWKKYFKIKSSTNDTSWGIYILELNYLPGHKRFKRIQIESVDEEKYVCVITDLFDDNGKPITSNPVKIVIPKDPAQNFTYISFTNGFHIINNQEPDKASWDFVFTRYTHFFYDILPNGEPFPYILTGVLSSKNNVEVAKDSSDNFADIDRSFLSKYTFSKEANAIGYDWKNHAFGAAGTYTVNSKITYIIKDTDGKYFKMRFLDFYDAKGEKGHPKFEFIQID
jgi:hypothetical protein